MERAPAKQLSTATSAFVLLTITLVGVAWWAMPRSVQAGDAGEMATVMLRGGVPHPSGYPWMRVLGLLARVLESLGVGPALACAIVCSLAGVLAWLLVQRLLVKWQLTIAGTLGITIVATSAAVVTHVNDSEVWGLHLLLCALVVYLSLTRRRSPLVLGVAFGLALSHHLTAALLLPLVVGAAWPDAWSPRDLLRNGALGVGGSLLGSCGYLTLAIGSGGAWRWGDTRSVDGLVHHVARADYGVTQLSLHTESTSMIDLWARAFESIGGGLSAYAIPHVVGSLLILGAIVVFARRPDSVPRPAWIGLWGAIGMTTLVFPALQNIDPNSPFGAWILERFDLLPMMLWTLPAATASARLAGPLRQRRFRFVLYVAPAALLFRQGVQTYTRGVPSEESGVETYAVDMLETPAASAVIFGTDDHRTFPALYASEVLGTRPDVVYVDASLLYHPWYRERIRQKWPGLPVQDKPLKTMAAIWQHEGLRDTPIYIANLFSRPAAKELHLVPEGVLWRVIPPGADPAQFDAMQAATRHLEALGRYRAKAGSFAGLHSPNGHPWSVDLWHPYVDHTAQVTAIAGRAGHEDLAARLEDALRTLAPAEALR
jgi:hypothetical protein